MLLERLVEQAFFQEFFLQRLVALLENALTGGLELLDDELVVPTRLVQADLAKCEYFVTVLEADRRATLSLPEPGRPNLGLFVLQAEIDVPGGGSGQVRDFSFDPDLADAVFEQRFGPAGERLSRIATFPLPDCPYDKMTPMFNLVIIGIGGAWWKLLGLW